MSFPIVTKSLKKLLHMSLPRFRSVIFFKLQCRLTWKELGLKSVPGDYQGHLWPSSSAAIE